MRCESCGSTLRKDALFCPECGEEAVGMERAAKMAELAKTQGPGRSADAPGVPEAPEPAEIPERVPDIPAIADLPEAPGMAIRGSEAPMTDSTRADVIATARLRETRRRATQALDEHLQIDLREKFAESATPESTIEGAGHYDLGEVHPTVEEEVEERRPPPPPPPDSVMTRQTRERATRQGLSDALPGEEEVSATSCLLAAGITLLVMILMILAIGFLINLVEEVPEGDSALLESPAHETIVVEFLDSREDDGEEAASHADSLVTHNSIHCNIHKHDDRRPVENVLHRVRTESTG